jgi:hypothetical protein
MLFFQQTGPALPHGCMNNIVIVADDLDGGVVVVAIR